MLSSFSHVYAPIIKKAAFIIVFFTVAPITIIVSFFTIQTLNSNKSQVVLAANTTHYNNALVYSPKNPAIPAVSAEVVLKDARPEIIRKHLRINKSPLIDYADYIVEKSDEYQLDYRLLVAIAQKESGLCKVIPENSHNCWGWGIHSKGTLKFDSYHQSIETVARGLKKEYIDKGYVTVEQIMSKWIPHSPEGVWAKDVQAVMDKLV